MSAEARSDTAQHLAIDLGASSGRVALGTVQDGRLSVDILHRFANGGVSVPDSSGSGLYWDILGLWREVLAGLTLAARRGPVASVGVTSWAVDYALLDERGQLLGGVHHYRDPRTDGVMEQFLGRVSRAEVYTHTGIQFLPFNTAYQLLAHERQAPGLLGRAHRLLLVPDLLHFWLSGQAVTEVTNASTTQLYDPHRGDWSPEMLRACGLSPALLPRIVTPGHDLGELRPEIAALTGLRGTRVIVPATHDTASAVAAVPAQADTDWAYVSSGTWSLVGVEMPTPTLNRAALDQNLTNEAGVGGTTRLLRNVMGLWPLQQCREAWGMDFAQLYESAANEAGSGPLIDPDDARFLPPGLDMPERVQSACRETGQATPVTPAAITRCILDSLAARTAQVLGDIESVTGQPIRRVHVVGGGSQIGLLNQLIADASGREVVAGPVEATLAGNLLLQAQALGSIPAGQIRQVVRASQALETFQPRARLARTS